MSATITCPKCGNTIQAVVQDTKIVQAFALCPKCNTNFKVS